MGTTLLSSFIPLLPSELMTELKARPPAAEANPPAKQVVKKAAKLIADSFDKNSRPFEDFCFLEFISSVMLCILCLVRREFASLLSYAVFHKRYIQTSSV